MLRPADSGDGAPHRSQRPVTGSARFLVVDAKVGVVREKIEPVTEPLDHGASQITGIRQSIIMESFVDKRKGTIIRLERR